MLHWVRVRRSGSIVTWCENEVRQQKKYEQ